MSGTTEAMKQALMALSKPTPFSKLSEITDFLREAIAAEETQGVEPVVWTDSLERVSVRVRRNDDMAASSGQVKALFCIPLFTRPDNKFLAEKLELMTAERDKLLLEVGELRWLRAARPAPTAEKQVVKPLGECTADQLPPDGHAMIWARLLIKDNFNGNLQKSRWTEFTWWKAMLNGTGRPPSQTGAWTLDPAPDGKWVQQMDITHWSPMLPNVGQGSSAVEPRASESVAGSIPASDRPTNCGTGHCSCVECVCEPVAPDSESAELIAKLRDIPPNPSRLKMWWDAANKLAADTQRTVTVTRQTYGHVVGACAECNTHEEAYTPLAWRISLDKGTTWTIYETDPAKIHGMDAAIITPLVARHTPTTDWSAA